jgi:UDP-2,4-diacetamido-2,4,6-trideoxy-beta-L-altropyranose hydrolase
MIIFRCDAGPLIGFGHLNRCVELARFLSKNDESCMMIGPDKKYLAAKDSYIFSEWLSVEKWGSVKEDAKKIVHYVKKHSAKMVILDDYRVNEVYQLILKNSGVKWLQFDASLLHPLWADYVVNANPEANIDKYKQVVRKKDSKLLLGPKFAILRPEFRLQNPNKISPIVNKILIMFGGGDDRGAILLILKALLSELPAEIQFLVISGANNPRNQSIKEWVKDNGNDRVEIQINPVSVASLFLSADLAIISGGSVVYEAASCGLPMMLISIAENQLWPIQAWANAGAAISLGELNSFDKFFLRKSVSQVVVDKNKRESLAKKASELCDGLGVKYITNSILS